MQQSDPEKQIKQDTVNLYRGRLICALLRKEGILADNSHIVVGLAENLLRSLAHHKCP
jgi:hypothetical protein